MQTRCIVNGGALAHRNRSDFCDFCDCDDHRAPQRSQRCPRQEKALLRCDLSVRWKVASDLRFRAAISEPKTPSFCGRSGDLSQSTRKSVAIAIVRFWCAKGGAQKSPLFWRLSGFFLIFLGANHPCKSTCLYTALVSLAHG